MLFLRGEEKKEEGTQEEVDNKRFTKKQQHKNSLLK
jgi:hypothetical protein